MCRAVEMFAVTLLLCLIGGSRQLLIVDLEVPNEVETGTQVELICEYDLEGFIETDVIVKWWWTPAHDPSDKKQLYQRIGSGRGGLFSRMGIEMQGNDTIVLLSPTPRDSGTYECDVSMMSQPSEEERKRNRLIVFTPGSGPNLTLSKVPDGPDEDQDEDVLIECQAEDVAPAPYLLLKINSVDYNWTEQVTGPDADGKYNVSARTTFSQSVTQGAAVACELLYHEEELKHPQYIHQLDYHSGAPPTTDAPEPAPEPDVAPVSAQLPSGDIRCRASWAALVAATVAIQLRAFSLLM